MSFASPPGAGASSEGCPPDMSADAARSAGAAMARSGRDVADAAVSAAALQAQLLEEELDAAASAGSLSDLKRMMGKGGGAKKAGARTAAAQSPSRKRARTTFRNDGGGTDSLVDASRVRCR